MTGRTLRLLAASLCLCATISGQTAEPQEAGPPAPAGTIRGTVRASRSAPPVAPRPSVGDLGMAMRTTATEAARPIVYLEKAPAGAFEERALGRARMTQRDEAFMPHVLAVRAGTTVDFPNEDETYHNVFSLSRTRRFDLGRYAAGRSKAVRFDEPGIVRVFCDIHSHMSAFILVFNHRYFSSTDANGRYEIPAVPPGRYVVAAWHEGLVRATQPITMPDQGGPVEINFELR